MEIKPISELVEENFKGLDEFIKDKDILTFYKGVIANVAKGYAENLLDVAINRCEVEDNNFHPVISKQQLEELKKQIEEVNNG